MKISTSILGAKDRVECVTKLNRTNTSYIHVDVMDGKFVSNTQFDKINLVNSINMVSKYPLDIHLMVENPIEYIKQYKDMNIEFISFHIEVDRDKNKIIDEIRSMGYKVGIAIKPNTDISTLEPYLDRVDMILIMSVEPGLGGQEFIEGTVNRIKEVRNLISNRNILIEVDGGVNDKIISKLDGVDIAVVGSYITSSDDYYEKIENLFKISKNKSGNNIKNVKVEDNVKYQKDGLFIFWDVIKLMFLLYLSFLFLYGIYSAIYGHQFCFLSCSEASYGIVGFVSAVIYVIVISLILFFVPPYFLVWILIVVGVILALFRKSYWNEKEEKRKKFKKYLSYIVVFLMLVFLLIIFMIFG